MLIAVVTFIIYLLVWRLQWEFDSIVRIYEETAEWIDSKFTVGNFIGSFIAMVMTSVLPFAVSYAAFLILNGVFT